MDNKANKDEFLGYINSLWKQGQISESALIKIRDEYCKEKLKWQEILMEKTQSDEQQVSMEKVQINDSEAEVLVKDELSKVNDLEDHSKSETSKEKRIVFHLHH